MILTQLKQIESETITHYQLTYLDNPLLSEEELRKLILSIHYDYDFEVDWENNLLFYKKDGKTEKVASIAMIGKPEVEIKWDSETITGKN